MNKMDHVSSRSRPTWKNFAILITIVSMLMILFGLAEIVTSFTHQFFGLSTADNPLAIILGVILGAFYTTGGLVLLTKKTWAAIMALALLGGDILGRIAMVILKLYPIDSFRQGFGILAGTLIAVIFAGYIFFNLDAFRKSEVNH